MIKFLKHLVLLPITTYLCFVFSYYAVQLEFAGLLLLFNLNWGSWIWMVVIFFLGFLITGLLAWIATLVSIANAFLLAVLYNYSWLSVILHSIAGIIAVFCGFKLYYESGISFSLFWYVSPFKTIVMLIPTIGIIISAIYSLAISSVLFKLDEFNNK